MRVLWRSLVVLCLVASPWVLAPEARAGDASFSVIVHSGNPTTAVRKSDLSKIFLKKIAKWPHGVPISVADQKASSEVRQAFSQGVHARSASAVAAHWRQLVFAGRQVPPPELASDKAVIAYVAKHPGAIGYVSAKADVTGVKVLAIK